MSATGETRLCCLIAAVQASNAGTDQVKSQQPITHMSASATGRVDSGIEHQNMCDDHAMCGTYGLAVSYICRFRLPDHLSMTNLLPLAQKQQQQAGSQLLQARDSGQGSGLFQLFAKEVDDSLTWDFIPWLRTITKLPIFVKVSEWVR